MMTQRLAAAVFLFVLSVIPDRAEPIDREALVGRHRIRSADPALPLPLGNGNFCVTVDGTGMQTFAGNTLAHWAWHTSPLPGGFSMDDVPATGTFQQGRSTGRDTALPEGFGPLRQWMFDNPHSANLGRLRLMRADGTEIKPEEITDVKRSLDLWTGLHWTTFRLDGKPVIVKSFVAPDDRLYVQVESELWLEKMLMLALDFPYPNQKNGDWVGDFDLPDRHETHVQAMTPFGISLVTRQADALQYTVLLVVEQDAHQIEADGHRITIKPNGAKSLDFCLHYQLAQESGRHESKLRFLDEARTQTAAMWEEFWQSGGAVDLSGSRDPRWRELERRIVLSQYLMRSNSAGDFPSAECGLLTTDPWRGQFHMEMIWWHLAHYALWNRLELSDKALGCYERFKPVAKTLAEQLDAPGYRWGKSVGPEGRSAPWIGNQVLLWKQPHPIFFAELEYRVRPTAATLEKWADIIEGTAVNMADYARRDETGIYHLDPVMPPSEVGVSRDTTFDLACWRFGLQAANRWRERMQRPREARWDEICRHLAKPATVDDPKDGLIFARSPEWPEEFSKRNWEHPDMCGVFGMLPPLDGIDRQIAKRTVDKMRREWNWSQCWGWDFPWMAMACVRHGDPNGALEMLLHDSPRNRYDARGVNLGGPCPYLPGNGGLLYVIAMMCAGWDESEADPQAVAPPGFPQDGSWTVRWEKLQKCP